MTDTTIGQRPAILNVDYVIRGDRWQIDYKSNLNLTGYTIEAVIHDEAGNDIDLTIVTTDLANGLFSVVLEAEDSADIVCGNGTWCLKQTPPYTPPATPETRTIIKGKFIVRAC